MRSTSFVAAAAIALTTLTASAQRGVGPDVAHP